MIVEYYCECGIQLVCDLKATMEVMKTLGKTVMVFQKHICENES